MFAYHFYILFILENSNHTQNEQKEICALGPGTTKILFSQKIFVRFLFFFLKKGSNNAKWWWSRVFKKRSFIMLKVRKLGHFWPQMSCFWFLLNTLKYFYFLQEARQCVCLSFFILKNSNYTQNEQNEMCSFGPGTTK